VKRRTLRDILARRFARTDSIIKICQNRRWNRRF
jgi:hypothetical protein